MFIEAIAKMTIIVPGRRNVAYYKWHNIDTKKHVDSQQLTITITIGNNISYASLTLQKIQCKNQSLENNHTCYAALYYLTFDFIFQTWEFIVVRK